MSINYLYLKLILNLIFFFFSFQSSYSYYLVTYSCHCHGLSPVAWTRRIMSLQSWENHLTFDKKLGLYNMKEMFWHNSKNVYIFVFLANCRCCPILYKRLYKMYKVNLKNIYDHILEESANTTSVKNWLFVLVHILIEEMLYSSVSNFLYQLSFRFCKYTWFVL